MDWLASLIVVLVVFVVLGAVAVVLKARPGPAGDYPYIRSQVLFSPAERSFLGVLEQAVGPEYRVFGKVRVADIIEPRRGLDRSRRQTALNRTVAKHFDFVLCAERDLSVIGVVELDDQSHQARGRQERDAFLADLCDAVSLPLLRIPAQRTYSVPDLRARVMDSLDVRPPHTMLEAPGEGAAVAERQAPSCPRCSAPMVRRRATSGPNAGEAFWGWSTFPKCRGIIPVNP